MGTVHRIVTPLPRGEEEIESSLVEMGMEVIQLMADGETLQIVISARLEGLRELLAEKKAVIDAMDPADSLTPRFSALIYEVGKLELKLRQTDRTSRVIARR